MLDISKELIKWMKNRENEKHGYFLSVLRELKTKLKDVKGEHSPVVVQKILAKMLSQRQDSLAIYTSAGRLDKMQIEAEEYVVIREYLDNIEKDLPKQMSEEEISGVVSEMKKNGATIREVMEFFKEKPADKKVVSACFGRSSK